MEIEIGGMTADLDERRGIVTVVSPLVEGSPGSTSWSKQGVEAVLLFGILAALTKPHGKSK